MSDMAGWTAQDCCGVFMARAGAGEFQSSNQTNNRHQSIHSRDTLSLCVSAPAFYTHSLLLLSPDLCLQFNRQYFLVNWVDVFKP